MTAHALCVDRTSLYSMFVEKMINHSNGDSEEKFTIILEKIFLNRTEDDPKFGDYQLYSGNNEVGRNFDYKLQLNGTYIYNLNLTICEAKKLSWLFQGLVNLQD